MLLGLSAVTSHACAIIAAADAVSVRASVCKAPPARHSLMPSHTRYAAPTSFSAVNNVAEVASSAPTPSIDSVMAVKSPSATPIDIGSAARQPWPSA